MKKLKFLAGIPRSGSTLLTSLLNQRPDTYASNTSNLADMLRAFNYLWETNTASPTAQTDGLKREECVEVLKQYRYGKSGYPIIFDKSRGWPDLKIIQLMLQTQNEVKIVATVRPMNECIASAYKLIRPTEDAEYIHGKESLIEDLTKYIVDSYNKLRNGYAAYPDNFLFIEYAELVNQTQIQMNCISEFIGVEKFTHDLNNVPPSTEEDKIWGIKDLHQIRPVVSQQKYSPQELLGDELWEHYSGGEFWNDKPEPVKKETLIDLQLAAGIRGNFKKGWKIAQQLEKKQPTNNRAAFNRGWYLLRQGKLLEGHKLLDQGRTQDVFGNRHIGSKQPIWNGEERVLSY